MTKQCELTGKKVMFGNNVSHAQNKSRRRFNVNLQRVSLKSDVLNRDYTMNIATSTLRSIDHNGGLDAYLLTANSNKITDAARRIKKQIKDAQQ